MTGLKDIWGVDDPDVGTAGNSEQAQKFAAAFKAALANINRNLAYTAVHGQAAKQALLAEARQTLIRKYQEALPKIDPNDASKAEKVIANVLLVTNKVEASVAAYRQEAEAAEKAWTEKEGEFQAAVAQIDELADWGDPQAAQFHLDASTTLSLADAHDYRGAVSGTAPLLGALKPVYAAYLLQKAAKAKYDPALLALDPRMGEASQSSFASLKPRQDAANALYKKTTDTAATKDYVAAVDQVSETTSKLDEYVAARDDLTARKQAYDNARTPLEPRYPQVDVDGGTGLADRKQAIDAAIAGMTTAAQADDFDLAKSHADDLAPKLTEYEALAQRHVDYEKRRAELQPRLPTSTEAGAGRLAEVQDAIVASRKDAEDAANKSDFDTALQKLDELSTHLDELAAILEARTRFEAALAQVQPRLPTTNEAGNGRLAAVQVEIATLVQEMQSAAGQADYDTASARLDALPPKLDEFEQQRELRDQYTAAWATVQPTVPTTSAPGSPKVLALEKDVSDLQSQVQKSASDGDYAGALRQIEALRLKMEELAQAQAAYLQAKTDFEARYAALKVPLQGALDVSVVPVKEVQAAQELVRACQADVDTDVKAGDYEAGLLKLDALEQALKDYRDELRKTPRKCDWVLATAVELQSLITIKYLQALNRINSAAQAYDDALAEHKKALKKVSDAKQLAASILTGLFFAGLGGAVGGAVGVGVKSVLGKEFADLALGGGLIDATKDVAKFTVRMIPQFGGKPGDPTTGLPAVGGSGVELARKVGETVNDQGVALMGEVVKLSQLVKANAETCNTETLRIDGDPTDAVKGDPFLTALGQIAHADKKTFARLLWAQWIQTYAYTAGVLCDEGYCVDVVDDNVEDFWGWLEDLTQHIEEQTGEDFGLRGRLKEARAIREAAIAKGN